jgi:hypothetical protein
MKFFPLSTTLHAMRHISQEQVLHADKDQLAEMAEQTFRLFTFWERAVTMAEEAKSRPLQ